MIEDVEVAECDDIVWKDGSSSPVVIIGMNIITLGDLAITNYQGTTTFSFRMPSQGWIDFEAEI